MKTRLLYMLVIIFTLSLFLFGCKDKKYQVKFLVDDEVIETLEVVKDGTLYIELMPKPEKELYNFVGWKDEFGNLISSDLIIKSNMSLIAEFKKRPTVNLTINYNNEFNETYEVLSWEEVYLEQYILPIENYDFSTWIINGITYSKEFLILDSDMTITAEYVYSPTPISLANDYFHHGKISVKGPDLVDAKGNKLQLIGLSTHGLQWFGKYVNKPTFAALKNAYGINVIRLSLTTSEGGYCDNPAKREELYNLVVTGVKAATKVGLYVIIDWHMVGAEDPKDKNPLYYKDLAVDFFSRISKEFKDYDNVLYEIMNEPNGSTTWAHCKEYANLVIPKIRENTDGIILVGNPNWTANLNVVMSDPLVGYENIMYTYHFYAANHKATYQVTTAYSKGFPVFISEHGGMESSGDGNIDYTSIQNWYKILDERNISYVAWNLSNSVCSSSIIKNGNPTLIDFSDSNLTEWGIWYKKWTRSKAGLK